MSNNMANIHNEHINNHLIYGKWWTEEGGCKVSSLTDDQKKLRTAYQNSRKISLFSQSNSLHVPHEMPKKLTVDNSSHSYQNFQIIDHEKCVKSLLEIISPSFSETAKYVYSQNNIFWKNINKKWKFQEHGLQPMLYKIVDLVQILYPQHDIGFLRKTEIEIVPEKIKHLVDIAMFAPMPEDTPPRIWISDKINLHMMYPEQISADSLMIPGIIFITLIHELIGHLLPYETFIRESTAMRVLDKELMEGLAIKAEAILQLFGEEEYHLYTLYRMKRLLPYFAKNTSIEMWHKIKSNIIDSWPDFFSSPSTKLFRTSYSRHTNGLVRIEYYTLGLNVFQYISNVLLRVSPWITP